MPPERPSPQSLPERLRDLRENHWPDVSLTQADIARALGTERSLSSKTVASWENAKTPKLPPPYRLMAYARFFATRRSVDADPPLLLLLTDLSSEERDAFSVLESELLALRDGTGRHQVSDTDAPRRSWHFNDSGPVTLICAQLPEPQTGFLAGPNDPNYTQIRFYAHLDALMELHGHIRAENSAMDVVFKSGSDVIPDDLLGHVVLLGGTGWNDMIQRFAERISQPVRQVMDPETPAGEIFVVERNGIKEKFLPKWDEGKILAEDVGLLVRTPNPLNSNRSLTICSGVYGRGVLGAVRSLTDPRVRDSNEQYIAENLADPSGFAILMRVPVIGGKALTPDFRSAECARYRWPEA